MYVCMYVFIKLHITTQSGPVVCMYIRMYISIYLSIYVCMCVCMYGYLILWQSMDQSGKVANPGCSWLKREIEYFPALVRA